MFRLNEESSKTCREDLASHQLINHYPNSMPKYDGTMDGLILFGKRKDDTPKTVYVKKYQTYLGVDFFELDDFMVFDIARACGITASKVKIKATTNFNYLFSTDITQQAVNCSDPHPEFVCLDKIIVRDTPYKRQTIMNTIEYSSEKTHEMIHINPVNLAKFILLCLLLRLTDLRASNTGILIQRHAGTANANIAMIDFTINYQKISLPGSESHHSLTSFVASQLALKNFLRLSSLAVLDEDDFLQAFRELTPVFLSACDEALLRAKRYTFESKENVARAEKLIQHWKSNYDLLQKFVQRITPDNSNCNSSRVSMTT